MSEKDTQKALNEQRKRQKELIELKKLREREAAGEVIEISKEEKVPLATGEKIKNFFHYYKFYFLAFIIIFVVLFFLIKQCNDKIDYDYSILINATEYISDDTCKQIEETIKKYCKDVNGDGEIHILILNCSRDPDDTANGQFTTIQIQTMQAQIIEGTVRIFIMDEEQFEGYSKETFWTDLDLPHFEGKGIAVSDTPLEDTELNLYKHKYYIGIRVGTEADSSDMELFKKIINAE